VSLTQCTLGYTTVQCSTVRVHHVDCVIQAGCGHLNRRLLAGRVVSVSSESLILHPCSPMCGAPLRWVLIKVHLCFGEMHATSVPLENVPIQCGTPREGRTCGPHTSYSCYLVLLLLPLEGLGGFAAKRVAPYRNIQKKHVLYYTKLEHACRGILSKPSGVRDLNLNFATSTIVASFHRYTTVDSTVVFYSSVVVFYSVRIFRRW